MAKLPKLPSWGELPPLTPQLPRPWPRRSETCTYWVAGFCGGRAAAARAPNTSKIALTIRSANVCNWNFQGCFGMILGCFWQSFRDTFLYLFFVSLHEDRWIKLLATWNMLNSNGKFAHVNMVWKNKIRKQIEEKDLGYPLVCEVFKSSKKWRFYSIEWWILTITNVNIRHRTGGAGQAHFESIFSHEGGILCCNIDHLSTRR